jgi:hypothetical protein
VKNRFNAMAKTAIDASRTKEIQCKNKFKKGHLLGVIKCKICWVFSDGGE